LRHWLEAIAGAAVAIACASATLRWMMHAARFELHPFSFIYTVVVAGGSIGRLRYIAGGNAHMELQAKRQRSARECGSRLNAQSEL